MRVCLSFIRFSSSLLLFFAFVLLSCFACLLCQPCLFVLSLWLFGCVVGFSFSLSDYTQKERARRVGASSLRVLWVCLVVQILVTLSKNSVAVALARSSSLGW